MSFHAPKASAPSLIEDDMFTAVVPLTPVETETAGQVTAHVTPQVTPEVFKMRSVLKATQNH